MVFERHYELKKILIELDQNEVRNLWLEIDDTHSKMDNIEYHEKYPTLHKLKIILKESIISLHENSIKSVNIPDLIKKI